MVDGGQVLLSHRAQRPNSINPSTTGCFARCSNCRSPAECKQRKHRAFSQQTQHARQMGFAAVRKPAEMNAAKVDGSPEELAIFGGSKSNGTKETRQSAGCSETLLTAANHRAVGRSNQL